MSREIILKEIAELRKSQTKILAKLEDVCERLEDLDSKFQILCEHLPTQSVDSDSEEEEEESEKEETTNEKTEKILDMVLEDHEPEDKKVPDLASLINPDMINLLQKALMSSSF